MRLIVAVLVALAAGAALLGQVSPSPFEILIVNGRVMDGSGNPWVGVDIGIREGRIAALGHLNGAAAARTIDARQRLVTPGFIDVHSHAREGLWKGR